MTLAIITGGSKGFGQAIAVELAVHEFSKTDRINHYLSLVLTGRDPTGLAETAEIIRDTVEIFDSNSEIAMSNDKQGRIMAHLSNTSGDILEITLVVGDLVNIVTDPKFLPKLLFIPSFPPKKLYLFHNAGSVGAMKYIHNAINDPTEISQYVTLNLSAVMQLSSLFLRFAKDFSAEIRVINISSLAAIAPFAGWSWYCSIKAARDMFMKVLTCEQDYLKNSTIKSLNYAPGMLDTNMQKLLRTSTSLADHTPHIEFFTSVHEKGQLLSPNESAKRMILILERDEFVSGDHIDYWDVDATGKKLQIENNNDSTTSTTHRSVAPNNKSINTE